MKKIEKEFSLIPFKPPGFDLNVGGKVSLQDKLLTLVYTVDGDIGSLQIPKLQGAPSRKDELWKTSCFECFFHSAGHNDYHELNLSPSGDWNLYRFTDYRSGMAEEKGVTTIELDFSSNQDRISQTCYIPLDTLGDVYGDISSLQVGISSVLLDVNGRLSYWALKHSCAQPDFHDQRGFCLELS